MFEGFKETLIKQAEAHRENFISRLRCYGFSDIEVDAILDCISEANKEFFD